MWRLSAPLTNLDNVVFKVLISSRIFTISWCWPLRFYASKAYLSKNLKISCVLHISPKDYVYSLWFHNNLCACAHSLQISYLSFFLLMIVSSLSSFRIFWRSFSLFSNSWKFLRRVAFSLAFVSISMHNLESFSLRVMQALHAWVDLSNEPSS